MGNGAVGSVAQRGGNLRPAAALHPRLAPYRYFSMCPRVENPHQVRPSRVSERVLFEVFPQSVAKAFLPGHQLQLTHRDGRLVIDDGAIKGSGFRQVGQLLPDRIGAGGTVDFIGGRVVLKQEAERMI